MTDPSADEWFAQIAREVVEYRSGYFRLGPELRRLHAVRDVGATEAIVFYSARVLEALTADALAAIRFTASVSVFSNLLTLEQYSLLRRGTLDAAHALRRLGNEARHIQAELTADHAELGLALTEQVLEWFFLGLPGKAKLSQLSRDQRGVQLATDTTLRVALATAEDLGRTWESDWVELRKQQGRVLLRIAHVPAIIAENWLDRRKIDSAHDLLQDALVVHPNDLRLQQLALLAVSRKGDLQAAFERVERLMARNRDDDETLGIAAGVYKRFWEHDRAATQWLAASHKLYRTGWKQSKEQNTYLGINAATTALWLGQPIESRRLAGDVAQLLSERAQQLRQCGSTEIKTGFWTQVTRAEALLLQRDLTAAAAAYRSAFKEHSTDLGCIQVARNQLQTIAEAAGHPRGGNRAAA